MSNQDDWVKAAMADESLVVDVLLTLKHAVIPINSEEYRYLHQSVPSDWRVRQRRTKPTTTTDSKKKSTPTVSPSTPLSWSGGTATESAAAADGFEESSRPSDSARSKVIIRLGTTSTKRVKKRSSKNMTELKEEEVLLISEKTHLTKEIAAVNVNLENERATNQSLKRLKVDLDGEGDTNHSGRFLLPDLNLPYEDNSM